MQNFRPPLPGEKIHMVCTNCGYQGMGKQPRVSIFGSFPPAKCPKCKQKTFVKDQRVSY